MSEADAPLSVGPLFPIAVPRRCRHLPNANVHFMPSFADFTVEEVPAYEPAGTGDHAYFWLQKKGLTTEALIDHVARTLGAPRREMGYAGLKDKQATTRQYISVPKVALRDMAYNLDAAKERLATDDIVVLGANWHTNKLRTGHLKGNRFTAVLRGERPNLDAANSVARYLTQHGFYNVFGAQRFGMGGQTVRRGLQALADLGSEPVGRRGAKAGWQHRLALSAVQSALFNDYVARRIASGSADTVIPGDVCQKRLTGGLFRTSDPQTEQERLERGEISIAGPMFGPDMTDADLAAKDLEQTCLQAANLTNAHFEKFKRLTSGTRRAILAYPEAFTVEALPDAALQVAFTLTSGAYATELLAEFTAARAGSTPN